MRDYSNSGLHSPVGVTIKGHHNIVQMETRNEKKDRFEIIEPQASQGEAVTEQAPDLATKYSTIYEKPYMIPFSNMSPQVPERAVGVKLGEGTAVSENIRPLTTTVPPLKNEPFKTDGIDVPTSVQDFTKSYEKTPIPDVVTPSKPIPEPTFGSFATDPLYPAQTAEEYQQSAIDQNRLGMSLIFNNKKRIYELIDKDGNFIRNLKMSKAGDRKLYKEITGKEYVKGQSPSKGYKSAMKSLLEGKK